MIGTHANLLLIVIEDICLEVPIMLVASDMFHDTAKLHFKILPYHRECDISSKVKWVGTFVREVVVLLTNDLDHHSAWGIFKEHLLGGVTRLFTLGTSIVIYSSCLEKVMDCLCNGYPHQIEGNVKHR